MNLEIGVFDDDVVDHAAVRAAVAERIRAKAPIFPNRALGMEYAVFTQGLPRGYPVAEVALANLKVGEGFRLSGDHYRVLKIAKTIQFEVRRPGGEVSCKRVSIDAESSEQFRRDVDGLLSASFHGVDAGDLLVAWMRDPISRTLPTRRCILRTIA